MEIIRQFIKRRKKQIRSMHLSKQVYSVYLVVITASIIAITTLIQLDFQKHEIEEKKIKLHEVAMLLDSQLKGTFDDILAQQGGLMESRSEKIKILNQKLQPEIDKLIRIYPEFGMGFYAKTVQSRVAFGPNFDITKINDMPKMLVSNINNIKTPKFLEVKNSTTWQGQEVITLIFPVYRHGVMVGRLYVNTKITTLYAHLTKNAGYIALYSILIILIFNTISWFYTRKMKKELGKFTDSVVLSQDNVIEDLLPELEPFAQKIKAYQKDAISSALENERLKTINQLSAGLANDIRNPLTAIKGFMQLLEDKVDLQFKDYVEVSLSEVDNINALITRMLYLAQPPVCELSTTDVALTIKNIVKLLETIAGDKNVTINTYFSDNLPEIKVGPEQLEKIIINLFKNALEAISSTTGAINIEVYEEEQNVCIRIKDNGKGIRQENIQKVFDPLFTTKNNGCGLGLAICKDIVARHEGQITIRSKIGKGTTVRLLLPGV